MLVFAEFVEFVAVSTCDLDGEPLRLVSPLVEGGGGGGGGPMAPLGGAFGAAVIVVSCNGNVKAVVSASACCLFHAEMASMLLIPIFGGPSWLLVSLPRGVSLSPWLVSASWCGLWLSFSAAWVASRRRGTSWSSYRVWKFVGRMSPLFSSAC